MLIYAGMHGCEELKGSDKSVCLLVLHQAVVVNDAIVHSTGGHSPGFSNRPIDLFHGRGSHCQCIALLSKIHEIRTCALRIISYF
jgi:hypothetical protein